VVLLEVGCEIGKAYRTPENSFSPVPKGFQLYLEYYECPSCGEKIYDREAMQKIKAYSHAFSKKVRKRERIGAPKAA
jgi:hypothetical protein